MHILLALLSSAVLAQAWTLNDVSILLPLPKAGQQDLLLGPNSSGRYGPLLPEEVYRNLPRLIVGSDRREVLGILRVVALRIDPCFRERNGPTACRPQIRMVWQPVMATGSKTLTADAAVHTFYDLDGADWSALIKDLTPLAGTQNTESLNVHPRILAEGLSGAHWSRLKVILLRYAGAETLSRATAMSVDTMSSVWAFTGINIENGVMSRIPIPRAHHFVQAVFADISDLSELSLDIRPIPDAPSSWINLARNSRGLEGRMSEAPVREGLLESLRLENPALEDTGSVDCVSCHIAQTVRFWGERQLPNWNWSLEAEAYRQTGLEDLRNNSVQPGLVNRLRAFGYFNDDPAISQRLIHESAEVLNYVRTNF